MSEQTALDRLNMHEENIVLSIVYRGSSIINEKSYTKVGDKLCEDSKGGIKI